MIRLIERYLDQGIEADYPVVQQEPEPSGEIALLDFDPLRQKQKTLEDALAELDAHILGRKTLFLKHRDDLEKRLDDIRFGFERVRQSTLARTKESIQVESLIVRMERDLRYLEIQCATDMASLYRERRELKLQWGLFLHL